MKRIEHPRGIIEEHDADGSKRFTGPGGGVLWIHADGAVTVMPEIRLKHQAVGLLIDVALRMPPRPVEIGDVEQYKEEARVMLEALRQGEKGIKFFRRIADSLELKTPSWGIRPDDTRLLNIISDAAADAKGIPPFPDIKARWRTAIGKPSEPAQHLKTPLQRAGFQWLCPPKRRKNMSSDK